jgi:hypothetical protein
MTLEHTAAKMTLDTTAAFGNTVAFIPSVALLIDATACDVA